MEKTVKLIPVRFRDNTRGIHADAGPFDLKKGDTVMVMTDHGHEPGMVIDQPLSIERETPPKGIPKVERMATEEEIIRHKDNLLKEKEARDFCLEQIRKMNLPMKLIVTEKFFDGSKIIFYFTSEGRVDFRELVKTMVQRYHTRIEMRQIGVRNEAKFLGGMGHCGLPLCCASFLSEFEPISIRMAKEQDLPLNPAKISGACGRLLCCLAYECKTYAELKKGLPKIGRKIQTQQGEGRVIRHNTLRSTIVVSLADGSELEISPADIETEAKKESKTQDEVPVS